MVNEKRLLKKLVNELSVEDPLNWHSEGCIGRSICPTYTIQKGPFIVENTHVVDDSGNSGPYDIGYFLTIFEKEKNSEVGRLLGWRVRKLYGEVHHAHVSLLKQKEEREKEAERKAERLEKEDALIRLKSLLHKGK